MRFTTAHGYERAGTVTYNQLRERYPRCKHPPVYFVAITKDNETMTTIYTPRVAPWDHQRTALVRVAERPSTPSSEDVFAWLLEMGTGKTKIVLDEWGERVVRGELDSLLVVAPAGNYRNWFEDKSEEEQSELRKHLDPELLRRTLVRAWISGMSGGKLRQLLEFAGDSRHPRVLVVNIEALSTVQKARDICEQFLRSGRAMMVIDESTTIKNPTSRRSDAVRKLGQHAAARRIVTGSPTPQSPLDLYAQFEFLDWRIIGQRSFYAFRARYAVLQKKNFGDRTVQVVVGFRDIEDLSRRIAPYSYRVLKEDCLDLPPKIYTTRDVELTKEQHRIYSELRQDAVSEFASGHVSASMKITQLLRMHQVLCGHLVDEDGMIHQVDQNRDQALVDILSEHSGKAIVWVCYQTTLLRLRERLEKEFGAKSVACFWGGNSTTRADDELRFLQDSECRFMLSTPAAGGRGNTWVVADLVVYFANSHNLEHRVQSEDRAHRGGQTRSVTYVDLVARGTLDEKIIHALRKKIDIAAAISGDGYRDWLI